MPELISGGGGGVNYVRNTEPDSPKEGETWYTPDTAVLRVYADEGAGLDWHPVPPVQTEEEAVTFGESDVSTSTTDTERVNGGFQLKSPASGFFPDDFEDGVGAGWAGDTGSLSTTTNPALSQSQSGQLTGSSGTYKAVNYDTANKTESIALRFNRQTDSGASGDKTTIKVYDSGFELVEIRLTVNPNDIQVQGNKIGTWSAGDTYNLRLDFDFTNDQFDVILDGTNEGTFNLGDSTSHYDSIEVACDARNSSTDNILVFDDTSVDTQSGDVLTWWETGVPLDIRAWDLVTYHVDPDGETVEVDVEDGNGNVLFSNIGQNFDISTVDTSRDVRLRFRLSRSDTTNEPRAEYGARRFTR